LISSPPRSFDIFDVFNSFDLDIPSTGVPLLTIQQLTAPQVWCAPCLIASGKNGGASYLQVLTSETNYFSAELNLVQAQLNERLALV
jgi:hypothetical protein